MDTQEMKNCGVLVARSCKGWLPDFSSAPRDGVPLPFPTQPGMGQMLGPYL